MADKSADKSDAEVLTLYAALVFKDHYRYILAETPEAAREIVRLAGVRAQSLGAARKFPGNGTPVIQQVPVVEYSDESNPKDIAEAKRRGAINYIFTTL